MASAHAQERKKKRNKNVKATRRIFSIQEAQNPKAPLVANYNISKWFLPHTQKKDSLRRGGGKKGQKGDRKENRNLIEKKKREKVLT